MPLRLRPRSLALLLVVLAALSYSNSLRIPFLLDDRSAILENPSIAELNRFGDVLQPAAHATTAGRPLLNLSFAANYAWGKLELPSYHVVNLAIHIASALVLFGLVQRTARQSPWRAPDSTKLFFSFCVAALWTAHPALTEAVSYISQRAESLMGLLYLATLYLFARSADSPRSAAWQGASIAACALGMMTKEVMVTAPVLVLLYDRAFLSGSLREALARRRWYYAGLAATWLLLAYSMASSRLFAQPNIGFHTEVGWLTYAATECKALVTYATLALWPRPLVFDYGTEVFISGFAAVAPFALLVALAAAAAVVAWRVSKPFGFMAAACFIVLAPTSSVVPVAYQPIAESRMYLPLAPLLALVVAGGFALAGRTALVAGAALAVVLGALTFQRNADYRTAAGLWADTVAKNPGSSRAHFCLAHELRLMPGRTADAIAEFEHALRLRPDYPEAHCGFANTLATVPGRQPEAIAHYEEALRLRPDYVVAHNNLANAFATMPGREAAAIAHYEAALRVQPDYPKAHYNLANQLARVPGRLPEAIAHYRAAIRIAPDYTLARLNLANALARNPTQRDQAIAEYEAALRIAPDFAEAHNNLAGELAKIPDRRDDAIAHYREAIRLKPDYAPAHLGLAAVFAQAGDREEALRHWRIARQLGAGPPASATP